MGCCACLCVQQPRRRLRPGDSRCLFRGPRVSSLLRRGQAVRADGEVPGGGAAAGLRRLVDRVEAGEIQYCPHGRPVAVKLSKYQVEKMFKRA